jgi:hypothetical protein
MRTAYGGWSHHILIVYAYFKFLLENIPTYDPQDTEVHTEIQCEAEQFKCIRITKIFIINSIGSDRRLRFPQVESKALCGIYLGQNIEADLMSTELGKEKFNI